MSGQYSFDVINGYSVLGDVNAYRAILALDGQILQKIYLECVVLSDFDNIDDMVTYIRDPEGCDYPSADDGWLFRGDIDCEGDIGKVLQAQWILQYYLQGEVLEDPLPFAYFLNTYGTGGDPDEVEDTPPT